MSTMRCVVTGASGFLGSSLVRSLVGRGYPTLAVVRPESNLWRLSEVNTDVTFAYAALNNILSIEQTIADFAPDVVFHLAWSGGDSSKYVNSPDQMKNLPGSLELANIAGRAQSKAFVFFGSAAEYGKFSIPVSESDIEEPRNLYGATKLAAMRATNSLCAMWKMRFCGVRPFWVYGPRDSGMRMIPSLIEQLLDHKRPSLTNGDQVWDYLYVDDAMDALVRLAECSNVEGVFNLGSGVPVLLRSVVERIRDIIDPGLELGFGDIPYGPNQIMHLQASIDRLKEATGWEPKVGLEEGLQATIKWHQFQRSSIPK